MRCFTKMRVSQKQQFADVFQNRLSYKFRNIHWEIPLLEPIFNKVAYFRAALFIAHLRWLLLLSALNHVVS